MSGKRIVFSTNTPNDQGFRIPNDVLNFNRYFKNPVLLSQHNWDDWKKDLLGHMTDITFENGEWSGIPDFHKKTDDSKLASELWEAGYLKACSIGGFKELKTTGKMVRNAEGESVPEIWTGADGLAEATSFEVYEISMVSIPSNMDAVQVESFLSSQQSEIIDLGSKINTQTLERELTTLSTKLKTMENEDELKAKAELEKEAKDKLSADKLKSEKEEEEKKKIAKPAADKKEAEGKEVIKDAVDDEDDKKDALSSMFDGLARLFGSKKDKPVANGLVTDLPKVVTDKTPDYVTEDSKKAEKVLFAELQEKVGKMKAKEEKREKLQTALMEASEKMQTALAAKEKAEKPEATDEDKEEFLKAKKEAEMSAEGCAQMEADMEEDDMSDEMKAKKKKEELAAKLSSKKVSLKTVAELTADKLKLAPKPTNGILNMMDRLPKSMAALKADKNGEKIFQRVTRREADMQPTEMAAYMSALRGEKKYKAVFDKTRIILNSEQIKVSPRDRDGDGVDKIIDRLNANSWKTQGGQLHQSGMTALSATDNFLASPDLFAMDFLDLAIFNLFPTTSWKDEIPIFGANPGFENNTGVIWANIAANPTIYMGSQPVNPALYSYQDTAVALNLTPFFMNPILWQPITMAQFRYDQMGTGWAQSMAVLGTYIDDFLLYTLGAAVPHSSIVYSSGVVPNPNGGSSAVQTFTLNDNVDNPYSFFWSPFFQGTLNNPTLNDVITTQTIYVKQNYELETKKPVLVIDPTTDLLLSQTAQTQSLLTRWLDDNGKESLGFKRTKFNVRSRTIVFNPITAQVLSPFGIIPSAATSANLGFIPDEICIGISNLDVFMVQSPVNFGYVMSADVRMGITPLRKNGFGTTILAYGPQSVS